MGPTTSQGGTMKPTTTHSRSPATQFKETRFFCLTGTGAQATSIQVQDVTKG